MQMYPPPHAYKEEVYCYAEDECGRCNEKHPPHHHQHHRHHDHLSGMKNGGTYGVESYKDDRVKSRESWYEKEEYDNNGYWDSNKLQMNHSKQQQGGYYDGFEPNPHHHYGNGISNLDDKMKRRESWYGKEEYKNGFWVPKRDDGKAQGMKFHTSSDKYSGSKPQNLVMEGVQEVGRVLLEDKLRKPVWNAKAIFD